MSLSFWFSVAICAISFLGAWIDHGDAYRAFKTSTGKDRFWKGTKVFLVVWGIPTISLFVTLLTGWESVQSWRNNGRAAERLSQIESLLPGKQPVRSLSAFVRFHNTSSATNFVRENRNFGGKGKCAFLRFYRTTQPDMGYGGTIELSADTFESWGGGGRDETYLEFKWFAPLTEHIRDGEPNETAEHVLNELNSCSVEIMFLWPSVEIAGGTVALTVNGSLRKDFVIQPAKWERQDFSKDPTGPLLPTVFAFPTVTSRSRN